MITEVLAQLPWAVNLIEFGVMAFIVLRVVTVLDHALGRAQGAVAGTPPSTSPAPKPATTPTAAKPTPPSGAATPGYIAWLKKEEGFNPKAYWDYKQYSIGYGTKANSSTEVITEAEATARLMAEVQAADHLITTKFPNLPLGQHQALLDLTYNAGSGWEEESLGKQVAAQKIDSIKADILLYNHAGGVVNEGLTTRRQTEVSWFDQPL